MTETEFTSIWNDTIHGLWPDWNGWEQRSMCRVFFRELKYYPADVVENACSAHFANKSRKAPQLDAIKLLCPTLGKATKRNTEPELAYILWEQASGRKMKFFTKGKTGLADTPENFIEKAADNARKKMEETYGGIWTVIQSWKDKVKQKGSA